MTDDEDYPIGFMFTLDTEGVHLNMNFICPQCNQPLSAHDMEVLLENLPNKITFACPKSEGEGVDETIIP